MKPVSENEAFVILVQVAEEDAALRLKLIDILSHPPVHRQAVLHFYIDGMKKMGAPDTFVSAVACLLKDAVAERVLELLRSDES